MNIYYLSKISFQWDSASMNITGLYNLTSEACNVVSYPKSAQQNMALVRRSHGRYFIKKAILKNFAIFTRKYLFRSLFLIKLQDEEVPVNIANFSRTPTFKNICERLLLSCKQFCQSRMIVANKNYEEICFKQLLAPCQLFYSEWIL